MKGAVTLFALGSVFASSKSAQADLNQKEKMVLGAFVGMTAAVASIAAPDVGVTSDGELALRWEPVYYATDDISLGAGTTVFPCSDRTQRYFAEVRHEIWDRVVGANVGAGLYFDEGGSVGPLGTFTLVYGDSLAFGAGVEVTRDLNRNETLWTFQTKLEVRWGKLSD